VGGNGAQMATCLARLDIAMRALGHPMGLHVKAFDADRVSEANVGRQLYSAADIGKHKALVTIHRLNQWDGRPHPKRHRKCHSGDVSCSTQTSRSVHHEDYNHWHRPGQECVSGPRR